MLSAVGFVSLRRSFYVCREAITELVGVGAVMYEPWHVLRGLKQCFLYIAEQH